MKLKVTDYNEANDAIYLCYPSRPGRTASESCEVFNQPGHILDFNTTTLSPRGLEVYLCFEYYSPLADHPGYDSAKDLLQFGHPDSGIDPRPPLTPTRASSKGDLMVHWAIDPTETEFHPEAATAEEFWTPVLVQLSHASVHLAKALEQAAQAKGQRAGQDG